jgi:hypothetical protein
MGQLREGGVPSDGKVEEWYVDIRDSKVLALSMLIKDHTVLALLRKY